MNRSATQASASAVPELRQVEDFLVQEANLLDDRKFEEWMALFDDKGYYWAPARPDQQSPLTEVSLFYDDRELMALRISRLRHERIHAQIPHARTVHLVVNPRIQDFDPQTGHLSVHSKFLITEYRPSVPEGLQRVFAGQYLHTLRKSGDSFKIVLKKVTLVNCDATFESLALYF